MSERHQRTVAKTVTWRCIATGTTMGLVYAFTGEAMLSAGIGALEASSKMVFYYVHERAWGSVRWGRVESS